MSCYAFARALIITACVFSGASSLYGAASVLDQHSDFPGSSAALGVYAARFPGQTFTVGITGQLDRFEVRLMRENSTSAPVTFEIRRTINGLPDLSSAGLLSSVTATAETFPLYNGDGIFTAFDLGAGSVEVSAGDVLSLCASSTASFSNWFLWSVSQPHDVYPNGMAVQRYGAADPDYEPYDGGGDLGFRTFVVPIPEPQGLWLLLGSLAVVRSSRQRPT